MAYHNLVERLARAAVESYISMRNLRAVGIHLPKSIAIVKSVKTSTSVDDVYNKSYKFGRFAEVVINCFVHIHIRNDNLSLW